MDKIKVYVNSIAPSTCDYVDMHSLEHPCSQAGERAFQGIKQLPFGQSGFLSDDEIETVNLVQQFSRENGLEVETIDLSKTRWIVKLNFYLKRWKTPVVTFKGKAIKGLPIKEELEALLHK